MPSPNSLATQRFALSASNATGASACPESLSQSEAGKGAHVKPPASDLDIDSAGATCNDAQGRRRLIKGVIIVVIVITIIILIIVIIIIE